jgi:hypothetical protein
LDNLQAQSVFRRLRHRDTLVAYVHYGVAPDKNNADICGLNEPAKVDSPALHDSAQKQLTGPRVIQSQTAELLPVQQLH